MGKKKTIQRHHSKLGSKIRLLEKKGCQKQFPDCPSEPTEEHCSLCPFYGSNKDKFFGRGF